MVRAPTRAALNARLIGVKEHSSPYYIVDHIKCRRKLLQQFQRLEFGLFRAERKAGLLVPCWGHREPYATQARVIEHVEELCAYIHIMYCCIGFSRGVGVPYEK